MMEREELLQVVVALLIEESRRAHAAGVADRPVPIGKDEARELVERTLVEAGVLPARVKSEERARLLARSVKDALGPVLADVDVGDGAQATMIPDVLLASSEKHPALPTVGAVVGQTYIQLLTRPGMGKKRMALLVAALSQLGLAPKDAE